jgi:hypothetical protein
MICSWMCRAFLIAALLRGFGEKLTFQAVLVVRGYVRGTPRETPIDSTLPQFSRLFLLERTAAPDAKNQHDRI